MGVGGKDGLLHACSRTLNLNWAVRGFLIFKIGSGQSPRKTERQEKGRVCSIEHNNERSKNLTEGASIEDNA